MESNHKTEYRKVTIYDPSLETMQEQGYDPADTRCLEDEVIGGMTSRVILQRLTKRQREIINCLLYKGMNRQETADYLMVSKQSINQAIPRIKKRLHKNGINYEVTNRRGKRPRISLLSAAS